MTTSVSDANSEVGENISHFHLTPAVPAAKMLENMRSAIARKLPEVTACKPHGLTLSVAAGGPSLADTYQELDGYVAAVNGSLAFLMSREKKPHASYCCGIMDAGEHIADMIVADPQVRYYVASICDPSVFDKLKDCDVRLWHVTPDSTADPAAVTAILNEAYPNHWHAIGGGCTMGLRWVNLGYFLGFRKFDLHGLDSSFRDGATHAYPDRADTKDRIEFCGRATRPNFLAQVYDFFGLLNRIDAPDHEPVTIRVFGEGLLQDQYQEWIANRSRRPLVCCVKVGSKYGHEYVLALRDGVRRHMPVDHDFVCFTDDPVEGVRCLPPPADLPGWWTKVSLFKLGRPLIYFDLDVVILNDLTPLLEWEGFGIIKDWWQDGFNSSVMKLTGEERFVWNNFHPEHAIRNLPGDQDYITGMIPDARTFPEWMFQSYKANKLQNAEPEDALAVIFHGRPKMPECGGWVADKWNPQQEKVA